MYVCVVLYVVVYCVCICCVVPWKKKGWVGGWMDFTHPTGKRLPVQRYVPIYLLHLLSQVTTTTHAGLFQVRSTPVCAADCGSRPVDRADPIDAPETYVRTSVRVCMQPLAIDTLYTLTHVHTHAHTERHKKLDTLDESVIRDLIGDDDATATNNNTKGDEQSIAKAKQRVAVRLAQERKAEQRKQSQQQKKKKKKNATTEDEDDDDDDTDYTGFAKGTKSKAR